MSNYPTGVTSRHFDEPSKRYHYIDNVLAEPLELDGMLLDADVRASVSRDSLGNCEVESLEIIKPIVIQHERFGPLELHATSKTFSEAFRQACEDRALKLAEKLPSYCFETEED